MFDEIEFALGHCRIRKGAEVTPTSMVRIQLMDSDLNGASSETHFVIVRIVARKH